MGNFTRLICAVFAASLVLCASSAGRAGTTGAITGRVTDANGAPVANATVAAVSPSQSATNTTDADGSYRFLSLAPDTYTLSVSKQGFDPVSTSGVTVLSDQTRTLAFSVSKTLATIGQVRSRSVTDLIKPGTTSDVYSVNGAGMDAAGALGGSGGLNQTYSAIASVPGTNVGGGQQGWYQTVSIRGGDIDQVGWELDGIPVNRAYDNAPQTMLSSLGQQELQVYTGGTPATADASGIAGYINQVIKTGTYPGFAAINTGIGAPAFYHKLSFEIGGATKNRLFSYYFGTSGADGTYRYLDQFNGASDPQFYYPIAIPTQNGFVFDGSGTPVFANGNAYAIAYTRQRDTVANFHLGIPHHNDGGRDDIQLLYLTSDINLQYYSSINDLGGLAAVSVGTGGTPTWGDGTTYNGPIMRPFAPSGVQPYIFPSSPGNRAPNGPLPLDLRDTNANGVGIIKLQYQRNFNSRSFARLYGYILYSNWFIDGPLSYDLPYGAEIADYEIPNHTRGLNGSYTNQLSDKNLLTFSASYTTSNEERYSNNGYPSAGTAITNLIDAHGNCYDAANGQIATCFANQASSSQIVAGTIGNPNPATPPAGSPAALAGAQWLVTSSGFRANYNTVRPVFTAASLTDQWKPGDKWVVNAGVRVENYAYKLADTVDGYPARAFWFQAYNNEFCFGPGYLTPQWVGPGSACPSGTSNLNLQNASGGSISSTVVQPRLGFTYSAAADTVFRGSFGIYARPENASWVQYNTIQQNLAGFLASNFLTLGYNTPIHDIKPDRSTNVDLSWEQHLRGTDYSFKFTPFYRSTQGQLQNFLINALTGLESGLNVGRQTSSGVELALRKGDFANQGLSAQLAYTYTRSRIQYGSFPNGSSVIQNLNAYIQQYNSYTSACATPNPALCGIYSGNARPSFATNDTNGNPATVTNPYYNNAPQPLFDPNGRYTTYDIIPGPFAGANGYETPHVASLILNYRRDKLTITPSMTYNSGASYGSPLVWPGYLPQGCQVAPGTTGAVTTTCTSSAAQTGLPYVMIPDPYTGRFDGLGDFKEPSRFTLNLALGYEPTKNVKVSLVVNNIIDKCYQRGYAWDDPHICVYSQLPSSILAPAGNFAANPPVQLKYPYGVWLNNANTGFVGSTIPLQATFNVQIKI